MKVIEKEKPTEGELMRIVRENPREMRNRWRGRLSKSADELAKEKDPVKRDKMERMFYAQKKILKKWEDKCK